MKGGTRLHVLMTADAIGGVWQYANSLAQELCSAGHRVTLVLLGPSASAEQRQDAARIDGVELVETGLPLDWLAEGPRPVVQAARQLAALANRLQPDVIHCNSPALAGAASFPVPVIAVAHGCVATWWQAARSGPLAAEFEWHARVTAAGLKAASATVAPSASFGKLLRTTYDLPRQPLTVHNGRTPAAAGAGDLQLNVGLTVGRLWDAAKGGAVLDAAAARIDVPILAAGALRGPHGEEFSPVHLQALGHQSGEALARMLQLRPVFLSAASFEPFGLAVLEAASAGCALVLSDIATFRELWEGAALFVPAGDADAFAAALRELMDDPAQRRALGEAARERSAIYTPAATAAGMLELYQRVLAPAEAAA